MALGPSRWMLLQLLKVLPKNLMSRVAGWYASWRWLPGFAQRLEIRIFSAIFGVNMAEVREPLSTFGSLNDFFTRALIDGARPIDSAAGAVVSPCDGAWGQAGIVEAGTILQVKGRPYSVATLLGEDDASRFDGGAFATLYLSPRDYHRFHTPLAGDVVRARYLPGALWPVNRAGVEGVDGLFAKNERVVAYLRLTDRPGQPEVAMVAVGATMVGKVKVTFDDLETNRGEKNTDTRDYMNAPHAFACGQEWGRFEFGSTVVLVMPPGLADLDVKEPGTPLVLGSRIGTLVD